MIYKIVFLVFTILLLVGCGEKVTDAPVEIHWDRDMCSRCVMVISDRKNATQLRDPSTHKLYQFDDIGCMALWFKDENIAYKDSVKIWVTDVQSGKWIDARSAFYTAGNMTPMAFGFSAYEKKSSIPADKEALSYTEVLQRIK